MARSRQTSRPWEAGRDVKRDLAMHVYIYKSKYKKIGVLPMRIVWSNVSSIGPSSERNRVSLLYSVILSFIMVFFGQKLPNLYVMKNII